MASELESSNPGAERTRRNIMKIGAIALPATLGMVLPASARTSGETCYSVFGLFEVCLPGGSEGRGNCFLKGTKIRTAGGERKIEDLAVGDLLPTMFGGLRPVKWIGHYRRTKSDLSKPWVRDALPIRIARSALGPNVPHADLCVTAAHSLLIDGVLVPAEMLLNGATITRYEPEGDELEFFHIKLESHDVVYAEGVLAETLVNVDEWFANFADYLRRYGMPATDEGRCAPVVPVGGRVELMSRLRSALSPWIDLRDRADIVRDRVEEDSYSLA